MGAHDGYVVIGDEDGMLAEAVRYRGSYEADPDGATYLRGGDRAVRGADVEPRVERRLTMASVTV